MTDQESKRGNPRREAIIGRSPAMVTVRRMVKRMAKTDENVLLFGEVGVGKEFLAQQIHQRGPRETKPFVTIHCNAVGAEVTETDLFGAQGSKAGLLEQADGGTLFLNNLQDLPSEFQVKFLTMLQQGSFKSKGGEESQEIRFRIVSAATPEIETKMESNQFRRDLFNLLNTVTIEVPPLRERRQDIPLLFEHFLQRFCEETGRELPTVPAEVFESMIQYDWPGNVEELQTTVRNLLVMSPEGTLSEEYLPMQLRRHPLEFLAGKSLTEALAEVEKYLIERALKKFAGNQSKAAQFLELTESTLRYKMGKHHLQRKRSRARA